MIANSYIVFDLDEYIDEYVSDDEPTCEADAVRLRQREHLAELLKLCEMGRAAIHGERSNVLDSYQWSIDEIPF